jgi:hypothetical protein
MNDFIHSLFINQPPAPATGLSDPLLAIRRSFGEGDAILPPARRRLTRRSRGPGRLKRPASA